jgi:hypothetical protein
MGDHRTLASGPCNWFHMRCVCWQSVWCLRNKQLKWWQVEMNELCKCWKTAWVEGCAQSKLALVSCIGLGDMYRCQYSNKSCWFSAGRRLTAVNKTLGARPGVVQYFQQNVRPIWNNNLSCRSSSPSLTSWKSLSPALNILSSFVPVGPLCINKQHQKRVQRES